MTRHVWLTSALVLLFAGPAAAEPVSASIAALIGWVNGLGSVGLALLQIAAGQAISAIQKARARKSARARAGIQSEFTQDGGDNSESFVLGHYATAGSWVCPPLSRGVRNKTLTYIVDLGGMPGQFVTGLTVDGDKIAFNASFDHGVTRSAVGDKYAGKARMTCFYGTQSAAPALLLEHYGSHPDFPWSSDMVGRGRCIAIVELDVDEKLWDSPPPVLFDVQGIPLFDPRTGATVFSDNLAVIIYNILRGFVFPDGTPWGGDAEDTDLPLSVWAAAMNECDRQIALAGGGTESQFRGGFEVLVDQVDPAEVIERFLDACGGDIAEEGGFWYLRVGAPALPSMFITDRDLIVSRAAEMDPFPGLNSTVNGLTMRFPNPDMGWEISEAERVLRTDLEAKDGGRRLLDSLDLSACPFPRQVQRVGQAYVEDSRRFITHKLVLPPDAARLPPLATVSWVSEYNQYNGKVFQIEGKSIAPYDLLTSVHFRETDPADYSWSIADELPTYAGVVQTSRPNAYVIDDIEVIAEVIRDGDGIPRRAAILVRGLDPELAGVEWRIMDSASNIVSSGISMDPDGLLLLTEGVLPAQDYLVGLRAAGGGLVDWSAWYFVTTYEIRIGVLDLDPAVFDAIRQDTSNTVKEISERANVPLIRDLEDFAEQASLEMVNAFSRGNKTKERILVAEKTLETREAENELLAISIQNLIASNASITAAVYAETAARITADSALSTDIMNLVASTDAGFASATQDITTLVNENQAQANSLSTLFATTGGHSTAIAQQAEALAGVGGTLQASIDVNGHLSGFALTSTVQAGGAVNSAFSILADQFRIAAPNGANYTPLAIYASQRNINGFTVPAGAFFEGLVTMDQLIVTGPLSAKFATIGHFRSAASGERLEIKDDQLRVFDANGVARVTLGRL